MRSFAVASACFGLALLALVPSAASARVRHCAYTIGHGPKNDRGVPLGHVATGNMFCSKALSAISSGKLTGTGNLETGGFSCKVTQSSHVGATLLGASVRCSAGTRSFSFSWAT